MKLPPWLSALRRLRPRAAARRADEDLFAFAGRVAQELAQRRDEFAAHRRPDAARRIEHEIAGYRNGVAVPSYRWVQAQLEGEISDGSGTRALPPPTARRTKLPLVAGLRRLQATPGLAEAVEAQAEHFIIELQPPFDPAYGRSLVPEWSGWQITRLWHRVALRDVEDVVGAIAEYARDMHDAIDKKPSWW